MAAGLETPVRGASLPLRPETPAPTQIPSPPELDKRPLQAKGGDGGSLPDEVPQQRDVPAADEESEDVVEEPESGAQEAPAERAEPAVLPEITEPRGRIAPWERGDAQRTPER